MLCHMATNFSYDKQTCHLLARRFLAELISSTLKMEAICSSETSVNTQRVTLRSIPEDGTLPNHRCENLKSYNVCKRFSQVQYTLHIKQGS
jgi:hypothetical protein